MAIDYKYDQFLLFFGPLSFQRLLFFLQNFILKHLHLKIQEDFREYKLKLHVLPGTVLCLLNAVSADNPRKGGN